MHLPVLVLPYHLLPSRWKTLVAVLTQTIPGPHDVPGVFGELALVLGAGLVFAVAGAVGNGAGDVDLVADAAFPAPAPAAADDALLTVTIGVMA